MTWADFNKRVARLRIDGACDALNPVMVVQEILSKTFAGVMPFKPFLFHDIYSLRFNAAQSSKCATQ